MVRRFKERRSLDLSMQFGCLFLLAVVAHICKCYSPYLEKGVPAWEISDRFCKSGAPEGRSLCFSVFTNDPKPKQFSKAEAEAICANFSGHLPRPRNRGELTNAAVGGANRFEFHLDAYDDKKAWNFRYSDGSIVPVNQFDSTEFYIMPDTVGSCLSVNRAYRKITQTDCSSRVHFTCELCISNDTKFDWDQFCINQCVCVNGSFLCIDEDCPRGECMKVVKYRKESCKLMPCEYNRFGNKCKFQCHCGNYQPCDVVTGDCKNFGCLKGWNGKACNLTDCIERLGGKNCDLPCFCANKQDCDPETGFCHTGCLSGFIGLQCNETSCPWGKFGRGCEEDCSCQGPTEPCHPETGVCADQICEDGDDCPTQKPKKKEVVPLVAYLSNGNGEVYASASTSDGGEDGSSVTKAIYISFIGFGSFGVLTAIGFLGVLVYREARAVEKVVIKEHVVVDSPLSVIKEVDDNNPGQNEKGISTNIRDGISTNDRGENSEVSAQDEGDQDMEEVEENGEPDSECEAEEVAGAVNRDIVSRATKLSVIDEDDENDTLHSFPDGSSPNNREEVSRARMPRPIEEVPKSEEEY